MNAAMYNLIPANVIGGIYSKQYFPEKKADAHKRQQKMARELI
jgi:hypothetical protein